MGFGQNDDDERPSRAMLGGVSTPSPPRPARPRPPGRRRSWVIGLVAVVVLALAGAGVGIVLVTRVQTGEWRAPEVEDFERIISRSPPQPARTIFLERHAIELRPGEDDAPRGVSSVLASVRAKAAGAKTGTTAKPPADPGRAAKLPGWKGTDKAWREVVSCVAGLFAPFDVAVTDQAPTGSDDYMLVAVGGRPGDLGVTDRRVAGLAPFNGGVIARPIVFAFSTQLGNNARAVCEAIGMEAAHAYGLDHGYLCSDVMTYLPACGPKRFVDRAIRCGEAKARDCEGGKPTQNSYRMLLQVLGARKPR